MKKIILSCAVVLSVNCVYAQKSNVNKANAAIAAAAANSKEINYEKIDEAWALIQPAMTDPVSSIMPETWNAAGRIQVFYMNKMLTDRNTTGELDTKKFFENQKMNFSMEIDNPTLTGSFLVSAMRAAFLQKPGAYLIPEIPPCNLLYGNAENLV